MTEPLSAELADDLRELVPDYMHVVSVAERLIARGWTRAADHGLREAAQRVVTAAEPDWGDEGWIEYLVPHDTIDALRAALAAPAAPTAALDVEDWSRRAAASMREAAERATEGER